MPTKYAIHAASLGSTVWSGVTGQAISRQKELHRPHTAGNVWNRLASVKRQVSLGSLTSSNLRTILQGMPQGSTSGLPFPCVALTTPAPLTLWAFKEDDDLPQFQAGTVHEKLVIAKGLAAFKSIGWQGPGEPAICKTDFWALSADGIALPWTASAAAAPAVPPAESDFELDSLTIEGTALDDISELDLTFENQIKVRWGKSTGLHPTYLASLTEGMIDAALRFRCQDRSLFRSYTDFFKAGAKQTIIMTFKDYANAGGRGTATATLEMDALITADEAEDGRPSSVMINALPIKTTADGVHPVRWSVSA